MRNLLRQNTKKIIAASLVFWMSGILFLFCCETTEAAEAESCPLAKKSHCTKQTASESISLTASVQSEDTLDCCRFLPQIFGKDRKIETVQKAVIVTESAKVPQPKFLIANRVSSAEQTFQSVIINQQSAHLKNCVFRI